MKKLQIPTLGSHWSSATHRLLAFGLAGLLQWVHEVSIRAEDHVDYRYETYAEENGRIKIRTHSAYFEKELDARISLKGEFVYDGISGSTPTGGPPLAGSNEVPKAHVEDIRRAGYVEPEFKWGNGRQVTSPQLSYSEERDYISHGLALNHSMSFNDKNTTVTLGVAHSWDTIDPIFWFGEYANKNTTDFLVGVTQILTKHSFLTVNLTLSTSSGYLSDPYKAFRFDAYPVPESLFPERRPGHRTRQVGYVGYTHSVPQLNGSADGSYRIAHDSYGILSHTASVNWYQNITKYAVLSPMFRFYQQSAADFYHVSYPGDPSIYDPLDPLTWPSPTESSYPEFYSADYRLSKMRSLTYGVSVMVRVQKWLVLDLAYKRYVMSSLDSVSAKDAFPTANVYSAGLRFVF